ncbi:uncharacterized protein AB9X84_010037 [Acanthopagrus schlegelii]
MRSILFLLIFSLMKGCEARSKPKGCPEGCAEFTSKKTKFTEKDGCSGPFNQTAYTTAKTTITCDYPGEKNKSSVQFFCKDNKSTCEEILSTKSSSKSKGKFTLTETSSGFSISISNVSKGDAGVYWCGAKTSDGRCRAALRSIKLKVESITFFKKFPTIGQDFTYYCTSRNDTLTGIFICKGEDPSICQPLVNSTQPDKTGKFSMETSESSGQRSKTNFNFSITVRKLTANDSGIYWCGAESKDKTRSNLFFHKFSMTVVPTPTPTPAKDNDSPHVLITVTVCVAVLLLLLFVLILILIYKRFTHSKNTRNGARAQYIKEDYIYAEIQERVQNPVKGNVVNTVYASANCPTNPSDSLHYSTITFKNCSNKAGGDEMTIKSRSACEYSTVKYSESPVYSSINEPSRSSHDPLYSTVTTNSNSEERSALSGIYEVY